MRSQLSVACIGLSLLASACDGGSSDVGLDSPGSHATVTATGSNIVIQGTTNPSVSIGSVQQFNVGAATGYTVASLVGGSCPLGTWVTPGSVYQTGVITGNCAVVFTSIIKTFAVTSIGTNLTATAISSTTVSYNGTQMFTVTPSPGYALTTTVDGSCPAGSWNGSVYSIPSLTSACVANFHSTQLIYTLSLSASNVNISPAGSQSATYGQTVQYTVTASSGYTVSATTAGTCPAGTWNGSVYTTGAVVGDCSITFGSKSTVTATATNATVSAPTSALVDLNATQSFTLTPASGFVLSRAVGGTCPQGTWASSGATYTTGAVSSNCSVTFKGFAPQSAFTLTSATNSTSYSASAVDGSGNLYVIGSVPGSGTYNFGNSVTLTSTGPKPFLAKYNSAGVAQWAVTPTSGASGVVFSGINLDASGNLYVVGSMGAGSYNFGTGPISGANNTSNLVLVKYNPSGVAQWVVTTSGGNSASAYNSVAIDTNGNIYAAGYFYSNGSLILGGVNGTRTVTGTATSNGSNFLLVKYDSTGSVYWMKTGASASGQGGYFSGLALDSSGLPYAVGLINGNSTIDFGGGTVVQGAAGTNAILAKFDQAGSAVYAKSTNGGNGNTQFQSVAIDTSGNAYAAGTAFGTAYFGTTGSFAVNGTAYGIGMLVKFDTSGVAKWGSTMSAASNASTYTSVGTDTLGNVYAAGSLTGSVNFAFGNGVTVTGQASGTNSVITQYNATSGLAQWAQSTITPTSGSSPASAINSISVDSGNSVLAVGFISSNTQTAFGNSVSATGVYSSGNSAVLLRY